MTCIQKTVRAVDWYPTFQLVKEAAALTETRIIELDPKAYSGPNLTSIDVAAQNPWASSRFSIRWIVPRPDAHLANRVSLLKTCRYEVSSAPRKIPDFFPLILPLFPRSFIPSILTFFLLVHLTVAATRVLFFDLLMQSSSRDEVGDWSEGRVGTVALIGARKDLDSRRRIWALLACILSVLVGV